MCAAADPSAFTDQARLGKLLSQLEDDPLRAREVLAGLPEPPAPVHRVGVTGSPGVGKSTLLAQLIKLYRSRGYRLGVVAVDPTSPFSGGAVLADRLRLGEAQEDEGVFIRSLGSRGSLGGVSPGASAVASVLEAAGYERILIETVGVGQTGYDVICLADTVVVLLSPEGGDSIQLLKAGVLEVGDIFAVNKSDRPGAELLAKEISLALDLGQATVAEALHHRAETGAGRQSGAASTTPPTAAASWTPPVLSVVASRNEGVNAVYDAIEQHRQWLADLPDVHPRRRQRIVRELGFMLKSRLSHLLDETLAARIDELAREVQAGETPIWLAASRLLEELYEELQGYTGTTEPPIIHL